MGAIRTAIWNKFVADKSLPLYSAVGGSGLHYSEATQSPSVPYCVFHIFDEIPDRTFDLAFEEALIQFDYYASSATDCDTGVSSIKTLYDYTTLSVSGYLFLQMERVLVIDSIKEHPSDLWHGIVRYELLIQES